MKKTILIQKRQEAKRLKELGWGIRKIARYLMCSTDSVMRWLNMDEAEIEKDGRGWRKGKMKTHSEVEKERIIKLREDLEMSKGASIGAVAIKSRYKQTFGTEISEWFVYRTLKEYGESKRTHRQEAPPDDCAAHLDKQLRGLGEVIMDVDFGGEKCKSRSRGSIHFLSCQYIPPYNLGILSQVSELSCPEVIRVLKSILRKYVRPDIVKMSYHSAFGANLSHRCCIGRLTVFLLNLGIKPLYSFPFGGGSRLDLKKFESIFSTGFLNRLHPGNRQERGIEIANFHLEYRQKSAPASKEVETENPYFMGAFTDEELENRRISRFLESEVFFLGRVEKKKTGMGQHREW